MSEMVQMEKTLDRIEREFRRHGLWERPTAYPPQVRMRLNWPKEVIKVAEILNRIQFIRAQPALRRFYGPSRDTAVQAFYYDYLTLEERIYFVGQQLKRLLSDLELLPHFSRSELELVH